MAGGFDVVGKSTPKRDGPDKITGRTRYLHDLELPRLAHGKILRTRLPHARIVSVDVSRARALPGVLAVLTGADVEPRPFGFAKDQVALKRGKVRCIRDEVAAVAAETAPIAEEALALIQVEYEELPGVFDPLAALEPGAPLVHDERSTNLHDLRYRFSHGDVESALAGAAVVVEDTYRLNFVTPACLGTMVAVADWDHAGNLTMWSTTQVPFLYQRDLGEAVGIGGDRVRVMQPPVGGNFGRGLDVYPIDVIAALLARVARRPVKVEFDRLEEFIACPTREPCAIRLRTAADRDGRLLARDAHVTIDGGAYTSWGSTTPYVMLSTVAGLYRVPNVRFDTTIVYTNNPYSGSMRGYGNPESTFAVESQMDDLADRLGIDRLELRRRNLSKPGDVNPQQFVLTSFAMGECLDAVADEIRRDPPPPRPGQKRGVGYAGMFHVGGGARIYRSDGCGAIVKLDDFGKVTLITGASEIGQGSETVLAMIVAETLGVPLERVDVVNSDTSVRPWDVGTHASRTTFVAGNAARLAAEKVRTQLLAIAEGPLEEPAAALDVKGGWVFVKRDPRRRLQYEAVARAGHFRDGGRVLVAEAFYDPPTAMLDKLINESRVVSTYEGARFHEQRYREYGPLLHDVAKLVEEGLQIPDRRYQDALAFIAESKERIAEIYTTTPVILVPAATGPAPKGLTSTGDSRMNRAWTALGTPAIALPMPVHNELPMGLQLTGAPGQDSLVLRAAVHISARFDSPA